MEITPSLQARLDAAKGDDVVDVVVELEHLLDGSFDARAQAVAERIASLRGEVTGRAWINSTLRARVPAHAVRAICALDEVRRVDVPHAITRD